MCMALTENKNIFIHARITQSIHEVPRIAHKQNTTTVEDILHSIYTFLNDYAK